MLRDAHHQRQGKKPAQHAATSVGNERQGQAGRGHEPQSHTHVNYDLGRHQADDANSDEVELIGKAVLTQGKDSFSSDRILYDRHKAVVKAGAAVKGGGKGGRVRITINPGGK